MRNGLCTCNEKKVDEDMRRVTTNRNTLKRLDALIALPLARFRRALTELTPEELEALQARIAVQSVKSRWARGGHGLARHRSVHELGLLARRQRRDASRTGDPAWSRGAAPPRRNRSHYARAGAGGSGRARGLTTLLNRERSRWPSPFPGAGVWRPCQKRGSPTAPVTPGAASHMARGSWLSSSAGSSRAAPPRG